MFSKIKINSKRIISSALALSMFTNIFGIGTNTSYRAEAKSKSTLAKFVKKHPVATAVTVLGLTALGVGAIVYATKSKKKVDMEKIATILDHNKRCTDAAI